MARRIRSRPYVPTGGRRVGKAAVGEFFETLTKAMAFSQFYRLRNGKITHFQEFTDSAAANVAYQP